MSNGRTREQMSEDMKAYWRRRKNLDRAYGGYASINRTLEQIMGSDAMRQHYSGKVDADGMQSWEVDDIKVNDGKHKRS